MSRACSTTFWRGLTTQRGARPFRAGPSSQDWRCGRACCRKSSNRSGNASTGETLTWAFRCRSVPNRPSATLQTVLSAGNCAMGPRGGVVTQRSAKPCTPVQFRAWPPDAASGRTCEPNLPERRERAWRSACDLLRGTALTDTRLFRGSSAVEQPAVNRLVVGSNPTRGASAFCANISIRLGKRRRACSPPCPRATRLRSTGLMRAPRSRCLHTTRRSSRLRGGSRASRRCTTLTLRAIGWRPAWDRAGPLPGDWRPQSRKRRFEPPWG
jgi:hypothetical protein